MYNILLKTKDRIAVNTNVLWIKCSYLSEPISLVLLLNKVEKNSTINKAVINIKIMYTISTMEIQL